jgi:hypothetical protein
MMRFLLVLAVAVTPAAAQGPAVRMTNVTGPASNDFRIGDRYEIAVSALAQQPVSVRTTRNGRTDWGPVIALTDTNGRWSTTGQFEKGDFGDWSEVWTVGGKLAVPVIRFSVAAPCLSSGLNMISQMSLARSQTCETSEGRQTFVTSSGAHVNMSAEQMRADVIQTFILGERERVRSRDTGRGDQAAHRILELIGVNALSENETRKALSIVRVAFERPERILPGSSGSSRTSLLLRQLADSTDEGDLKQQIAETMAYVQAESSAQ